MNEAFSNWIVEFSAFLLPVFKETTHTHTHRCSRLLCTPRILYKDTALSIDAQSSFLRAKRWTERTPSLRHAALMTLFEERGAHRSPPAQPHNPRHRTERRLRGESTVARNRRRKISPRTTRNLPFFNSVAFIYCSAGTQTVGRRQSNPQYRVALWPEEFTDGSADISSRSEPCVPVAASVLVWSHRRSETNSNTRSVRLSIDIL